MRKTRLELEQQKLDQLFQKVSNFQEEEIKSHLSKYLCVQASGFLENVIRDLIAEYHDGTCSKQTAFFVNSRVETFTNVNDEKLKKFLKAFSEEWLTNYNTTVTERHLDSLNSIISQRNLIAHGKESRSNISYNNISRYYEDLKEVVGILKVIIKKK